MKQTLKVGDEMTEELKLPEFLNRNFEDIMEEMVASIPEDIDMSEGNHPYNLLAPTAKQEEYFAQGIVAEAVRHIFPKFCEGYGELVDCHAEVNGLSRKEPLKAKTVLTVTGEANTQILQGTMFSTVATDSAPSITFSCEVAGKIESEGVVTIPAEAVEAGVTGNVAANTITLQETPNSGIASVTNLEAATGGMDEESDASLIARIVASEKMQGLSYVGNDSDYKRWAEEIPGTGTATVIPPEDGDDTGQITIILTNSWGQPATLELCQQVKDYIISPDDRSKRKAPVNGAVLVVRAPEILAVKVKATITLTDEATLDSVKTQFIKAATEYLTIAPREGKIKYTKMAAILSGTEGVADYDSLSINGNMTNLSITATQFPQIPPDGIEFIENRGAENNVL